jgi:hypothetical protein
MKLEMFPHKGGQYVIEFSVDTSAEMKRCPCCEEEAGTRVIYISEIRDITSKLIPIDLRGGLGQDIARAFKERQCEGEPNCRCFTEDSERIQPIRNDTQPIQNRTPKNVREARSLT